LIPAQVVVDSINTLVGDVTLSAGAGISIPGAVGQTITVSNTGILGVNAGPGITVSAPVAGAVTVSAPGPLTPTDDANETLAGGVLVQVINVQFPETLTVTQAGMYLMEVNAVFANTNPGDAVVWGADDYIEISIPGVRSLFLKPWSVPVSPAVTSVTTSVAVALAPGVYTPEYSVFISSGSTTPAGEPNLNVTITKL
jgi:hypothetical protein